MQSISSLTYPGILRRASRGILVLLLACMPWATLSPAASPPSQWAALMHMGAMAVFALLSCTGFNSLCGRTGAVLFVFIFSALMEGLQYFSPLRTGSWEDVAINALGCLAGVLLFAALATAGLRTTTPPSPDPDPTSLSSQYPIPNTYQPEPPTQHPSSKTPH